jgi:hypothetical protein
MGVHAMLYFCVHSHICTHFGHVYLCCHIVYLASCMITCIFGDAILSKLFNELLSFVIPEMCLHMCMNCEKANIL